MTKSPEKDIAEKVLRWLESEGWDVYQEVCFGPGIADFVAVNPAGISWVLEVKKSFALAVLAQAWHWINHSCAHQVSVAVPFGRNWKTRTFAEAAARSFGIGVLYVSAYDVQQRVDPTRIEKPKKDIVETLSPEHKTHASAGSVGGGYWTEFKATCAAVLEFVTLNPGCTGRELSEGIEHHYASNAGARSTLTKWAKSGKLPCIRVTTDTRPAKFWPVAEGHERENKK